MSRNQKPHKEHLPEIVEKKHKKREQAQQEKKKPIFFGLGMLGMIGWTVAAPAVLGALIGRRLDELHLLDNRMSWTLTCLFAGLFLGIVVAWHWLKKESGSR
ncbi:MAG: AtpZ/AtpI family protein [Deltaproteobacteria bacterium]|nr:AtpZ/AtpI family protein [Deltaproteobacteria bacterium]